MRHPPNRDGVTSSAPNDGALLLHMTIRSTSSSEILSLRRSWLFLPVALIAIWRNVSELFGVVRVMPVR